jgi:uncharacterized ferritin-like protein (DUF455 family)
MRKAVVGDTKVVRGVVLRRDPAREPCFRVVELHEEVPDSGMLTEEARLQRIHREYNQEAQTLEVAALCLTDFWDAPWELRLELARQCWDEARHTALLYRRLREMGGWKGMYPIANLDWSVVGMLDSLAARLAIQHRTFEAGSLDIEAFAIPMYQELGDHKTAEVKEAIEADEIPHVRFANEWLKRLADADPRTVLQVAAAMTWLRRIVQVTGGEPLHEVATAAEARELAGFSTAEIAEVTRLEQEVMGSAAVAPSGQRGE